MNADKAKELGTKVHAALVKEHGRLSGMNLDGGKSNDVSCKYSPKDALADVEGFLAMLSEKSGLEELKWTPPAPKMEGMTMEEMEKMMMEGEPPMEPMMEAEGGNMEKAMEAAMEAAAPFFDAAALGQVAGPEELPKLLLEGCCVHPYVGDLVRS